MSTRPPCWVDPMPFPSSRGALRRALRIDARMRLDQSPNLTISAEWRRPNLDEISNDSAEHSCKERVSISWLSASGRDRKARLMRPGSKERAWALDRTPWPSTSIIRFLPTACPTSRRSDLESDLHWPNAACHQILTMILGKPADNHPASASACTASAPGRRGSRQK